MKTLLHEPGASSASDADVMIFPTFQQEAINLTADYDAFKSLLRLANAQSDLDLFLTSGYVNFPSEVVDLLTAFRGKLNFLFAAPQANSFFHDPSFASVIPALYNIVGLRGWSNGQLQCDLFHRCTEKHADVRL